MSESLEDQAARIAAERNGAPAQKQRAVRGRPFPKGKSGNPGGMKKGTVSLTRILRDVGAECPTGDERTYYHHAATALWEQARKGNVQAIALLFDRLEGKPKDPGDESTHAGLLALAAAIKSS